MSCQYNTRKERKEESVEGSLSLCHGHRIAIKRSSPRWFHRYRERLHNDTEKGCTCRKSYDLKSKSNKISQNKHLMFIFNKLI